MLLNLFYYLFIFIYLFINQKCICIFYHFSFCVFDLRPVSQKVHQISICKTNLKNTFIKLLPQFSGSIELKIVSCYSKDISFYYKSSYKDSVFVFADHKVFLCITPVECFSINLSVFSMKLNVVFLFCFFSINSGLKGSQYIIRHIFYQVDCEENFQRSDLTHWGLVTPFSDIDLGQHWPR